MKKLEILPSLADTLNAGWMRDDLPLFHTIAVFNAGEICIPSAGPQGGPHWPCKVCEYHGFSEDEFYKQAVELGGKVVTKDDLS